MLANLREESLNFPRTEECYVVMWSLSLSLSLYLDSFGQDSRRMYCEVLE